MGIDTHGIHRLKIAGCGLVRNGSKLVGLGVDGVGSLLACDRGLFEDSDLLLGDGGGLLAHDHHVGAILGLENHGLIHRCGDNTLESGDHIGLGHPADVSKFTVSRGVLVYGEFRHEGGETSAPANDSQKAVCKLAGIGALKQDVLYICGIRHGLAVHHADCIEGVAIRDDGRNLALAAEHEIVNLAVDAVQFAGLVPVVVQLTVRVLEKKCLHVLGASELGVRLGELLIGGSDILGGRNNLEYHIFDIAAGLLLEELGM